MTDIASLHHMRQTAKPGWMFKPELRAAIRSGCKTMTRRIEGKPKYAVGDVVYMREPIRMERDEVHGRWGTYSDDKEIAVKVWRWNSESLSSMLMPREAARTFLRIVEVRRELLLDITEQDAAREGVIHPGATCRDAFLALWDSIHGNHRDNPVVTVYRFEVIRDDKH